MQSITLLFQWGSGGIDGKGADTGWSNNLLGVVWVLVETSNQSENQERSVL